MPRRIPLAVRELIISRTDIEPSAAYCICVSRLRGSSRRARHAMNFLPAKDAFFTILTMSLAFLIEIAVFALIGMF